MIAEFKIKMNINASIAFNFYNNSQRINHLAKNAKINNNNIKTLIGNLKYKIDKNNKSGTYL